MSASIGQLIPQLRPYATALVNIAAAAGLAPRVTSTRRSHAEQARLYRRFLAGQQPYPVAPPGASAHEYGYAFDMIIAGMRPSDFADLGTVWKGWGGIWGGAFQDPIHFEYPGFSHPAVPTFVARSTEPQGGNAFYKLADFLSSFVPGLGQVQIVDTLVSLFDGNNDVASWYLQHPAEAIRDLAGKFL